MRAVLLVEAGHRERNSARAGDQANARQILEGVLRPRVAPLPQSRAVPFQYGRPNARLILSRILWLQGLAEQGLEVVKRNLVEGRTGGHALTFCSVLGQGACPIALMSGDLDAAESYCMELLDHTARHPIRLWRLWVECFRGLVMTKRGDVAARTDDLGWRNRAGKAR